MLSQPICIRFSARGKRGKWGKKGVWGLWPPCKRSETATEAVADHGHHSRSVRWHTNNLLRALTNKKNARTPEVGALAHVLAGDGPRDPAARGKGHMDSKKAQPLREVRLRRGHQKGGLNKFRGASELSVQIFKQYATMD